MNLVALIGNVSTDPTLVKTESGTSVCYFDITVTNAGNVDTFNVVTFDRQAEVCAQYLQNGRRVGIEGRLQLHAIEVRIVANRVNILSSPFAE